MRKKKKDRVYYYQHETDEFIVSRNQDYALPEEYKWVHMTRKYRFFSSILYVLVRLFGFCYCRGILRVRIVNSGILRKYREEGIFLYGNHTQPVGDAFIPIQICGNKHIYAIVSTANLGIPVLGKLLPMIGALPIPVSLPGMREFLDAIEGRIKEKKCMVIYPEAHVWPYCTFIRPFQVASFRYPVSLGAPSFCMTTTYQKRKRGKRPKILVYIDGPFWPDKTKSRKEQQKNLCAQIHECMVKRAQDNTYEYVRYEKEIQK